MSDEGTSYRYFNTSNGAVAEFDHQNTRLESYSNWVRVNDDDHLTALEEERGGAQRSGRGNLLGSSNIADRIEPRHQVEPEVFEPKVEFTDPSKTQLPGQHPDPEDFHPEKQPEVITVDPSQQVEPKTGPDKRELTTEGAGPDPANRPARSATRSDWVNWAVECGADRNEAEGMTKKDLIEVYGD